MNFKPWLLFAGALCLVDPAVSRESLHSVGWSYLGEVAIHIGLPAYMIYSGVEEMVKASEDAA